MRLTSCLCVFAVSALVSLPIYADDRGEGPNRRIVTVGFGAGLNTAQPGNAANHHVIPDTIRVNVGDVVNFAVAGLHFIRVYANGVKLTDVKALIPDECEINPVPALPQCGGPPVPVVPVGTLATYYQGINPLVSPQPGPPFAQATAATNRIEPVVFTAPGRYLVICAILPHFNDKMYAWIEVRARGDNSGQH